MTPQRQSLEEQFKQLILEKKAANGVNDEKFANCSESIIAVLEEISRLPEDNILTDFEVGSYCWAALAVVSKTRDLARRREAVPRLVRAFRKALDSSQFWGDARSSEFGRMFFNSMITALYKVVKESNAEAGEAVLRKVGRAFVEILELRADVYLDEIGFKKDLVSDEQRIAMQRSNAGRPVRLKAWPSIAEKAFGLLNRCLKADSGLVVSQELVDFLCERKGKGDWLDLYCANAMMRIGRFDDARRLFIEIVRRKQGEFWAWMHLAESSRENIQDAMAFFCRVLTCRIHDAEIEKGVKAKVHRQLAKMFATLGDATTAAREIDYANGRNVIPEDIARYDIGAKNANRYVFGCEALPTKRKCDGAGKNAERIKFSGKLIKPKDKDFGFVKCREAGDVFIPPSFAAKKSNGDIVSGYAMLKEDKKKKRMALCMISDL